MHYKHLLDVTQRFKSDGVYEETIQQLQWSSPDFICEDMVGIFKNFLGAWHSLRKPLDKDHLIDIWIREIEPYAIVLANECLENLDINKLISKKGEKIRVGIAIEHMYGALSAVVGVGNTNVTKLLHLRLPYLFVMTDNDIRSIFKMFKNHDFSSYSYSFNYLVFIKSHLNEALNTLCTEKKITRQQGIDFLQNAHNTKRSLAKLMDECYYVLAHKSVEYLDKPEYLISFLRTL